MNPFLSSSFNSVPMMPGLETVPDRSHQTLKVTPPMAAGVSKKLWEVSDIVEMLEQRELANFKPEYQFVVRQTATAPQ
jgi:hypothetical protein